MFFYSESDSGTSGGAVASWSEIQKLTASDKGDSDSFGRTFSFSQDGSILAIGVSSEDPDGVDAAGSVYIFQNQNGVLTETQKITASNKEVRAFFGSSVSISGDGSILAIGASSEDTNGLSHAGSVYIFQNQNGTWIEAQKLTASDKASGDNLGRSVSISNDGLTLIAGAVGQDPDGISNAGSVYIFQNNNSTWTEVQKLTASDKEASDLFGGTVLISQDGSTLVVGARFEDPDGISNAGSAYIFQKQNGFWTEVQKLTASDKEAGDYFGMYISISGDGLTLAVGVYSDDFDGLNNAGSVYIFQKQGGSWTETQKLTASDKEDSDRFGGAVSISQDGSTLAVGASYEDPAGVSDAGSVYIFQNVNGTWTETQKITASDKEPSDYFGSQCISFSGDGSTVAVASYYEDPDGISNAGSVYIFQAS